MAGDETDESLLARFARGEPEALDALVARHGGTVYAFLRRFLGGAAANAATSPVADDCYQEVWLKVIRYAGKFEGRSRFTTWLFQIARNVCLDARRAKKRRPDPSSLEREGGTGEGETTSLREHVADPGPGTDERAASREEQAAVTAALATLPDEQREVVLLRETTGLTFEEIGALAGLSTNTVKSRMRYALQNLRRALDPGAVRHGV